MPLAVLCGFTGCQNSAPEVPEIREICLSSWIPVTARGSHLWGWSELLSLSIVELHTPCKDQEIVFVI